MSARTSATIRPALPHLVDLAGDLRVIIAPGGGRPAERLEQGRRDVLDRPEAVDRRQDAPGAVVVGDVVQRPELLLHARADGRLGVVGPMDELGAVDVAHAPDVRRLEPLVVDVAAGLADEAAGKPPDEVLDGHLDEQRPVDRPARRVERRRRAPRPGAGCAGSRRGSRRRRRRADRAGRGTGEPSGRRARARRSAAHRGAHRGPRWTVCRASHLQGRRPRVQRMVQAATRSGVSATSMAPSWFTGPTTPRRPCGRGWNSSSARSGTSPTTTAGGVLSAVDGLRPIEAVDVVRCSRRSAGPAPKAAVITRKSPARSRRCGRAGRIVAEVLALMESELRPGVSDVAISTALAERHIRAAGRRRRSRATWAAAGTAGAPSAFPASTCISIDCEVVHGIPGERTIRDGSLV